MCHQRFQNFFFAADNVSDMSKWVWSNPLYLLAKTDKKVLQSFRQAQGYINAMFCRNVFAWQHCPLSGGLILLCAVLNFIQCKHIICTFLSATFLGGLIVWLQPFRNIRSIKDQIVKKVRQSFSLTYIIMKLSYFTINDDNNAVKCVQQK